LLIILDALQYVVKQKETSHRGRGKNTLHYLKVRDPRADIHVPGKGLTQDSKLLNSVANRVAAG